MSGSNFNDTDNKAGSSGTAGTIKLDGSTATLASDFTVTQTYSETPGGNMAQVSSVQVSVTTKDNEKVLISFSGAIGLAATSDIAYGYQIDSDTPVICGYSNQQGTLSLSFTALSAALSAGSHTIKLMACKGTGTTIVKGVGTGNYCNNYFSAVVLH